MSQPRKTSFDMRILPTGSGFALAFGWLWFPALRDILLSGLFTGQPSFNLLAFSFAFVTGVFYTAIFANAWKTAPCGNDF